LFGLDECEALILEKRVRQFLAGQLGQLRLWIKQLDLAGAPRQENKDAVLGAGRKMRRLGRERTGLGIRCRQQRIALEQGRERQRAESAGSAGQEAAAGLPDMFLNRFHNLQSIPS
jgi:hypothetical protein